MNFVIKNLESFAELADINYLRTVGATIAGEAKLTSQKSFDFCQAMGFVDFDRWTKTEQQMFYNLFKDSQMVDVFVGHYNSMVSSKLIEVKEYRTVPESVSDSVKKFRDKILNRQNPENPINITPVQRQKILQKVAAVDSFLKAEPYNNPFFADKIFRKVISWSAQEEIGSAKIHKLLTAMSLYSPMDVISNYCEDDTLFYDKASNQIDLMSKVKTLNERTNTSSTSLSLIGAMVLSATPGTIDNAIDFSIAVAKAIGTQAPFLMEIPFFATAVGPVGVGLGVGAAIYFSFEKIRKVVPKVIKKFQNKQIENYGPEALVKEDFFHNYISEKIFSPLFSTKDSIANNEQLHTYGATAMFLTQKLKEFPENPYITQEFLDFANFSEEKFQRLKNMNVADIHKFSMIPTISAKNLFASYPFDSVEENIIFNLSYMEKFYLIKKNQPETFYKTQFDTAVEAVLDTPLFENITDNQREILSYYISILAKYDKTKINDFLNSFAPYASLSSEKFGELFDHEIRVKTKDLADSIEVDENLTFTHLKMIGAGIVKLPVSIVQSFSSENKNNMEYLIENSRDTLMTQAQDLVYKNLTWFERVQQYSNFMLEQGKTVLNSKIQAVSNTFEKVKKNVEDKVVSGSELLTDNIKKFREEAIRLKDSLKL